MKMLNLRETRLVLLLKQKTQKYTPKIILTSSAIALVMLLNACGEKPKPTSHIAASANHNTAAGQPAVMKFNATPTSHAGNDQIVRVGDVVTLNGTQSTDPDHDLMTFSWAQQSGPAVEIVNADTLTPSFIAPASKQALTFALTVNDGQVDSEPSVVTIGISNRAPLANAGRTIIAKRGSKVMLDGSSSIDPDKDNLTYEWSQVYGDKVSLSDRSKISPSFTMPNASGYMVFALTVKDGTDSSIADTVAVKISNTAPVAKITSISNNVMSGKKVQLDGSGSSDADGDALAFNWSQVLGTPVMLEDANTATPRFDAPARPDHLVFELTVNDGEKTSHPDSLVVSIKNEVKSFEAKKADLNKIVKKQNAKTITPANKVRKTLAVADSPAPVENFLPKVTEGFVASVPAKGHATASHGKSAAKHDGGHAKAHWSYEGDGAPANWSLLDEKYKLCGTGQLQSPIDIQTSGMKLNPQPIEFHYSTSAINVVNNGHTIQANYDKGSYANIGGKRFDLLQFHFHSPSEHTIDSKPADMVAHLVHKAGDGTLGVVGVLFKKGKENEFLKAIWSNLPLESGMKTESSSTIYAANMLPDVKSYYHYTGSLTTPPCSEGVNWNVMTTAVEASEAQIDAFNSIFAKSVRPTQPLHGRKITMQ